MESGVALSSKSIPQISKNQPLSMVFFDSLLTLGQDTASKRKGSEENELLLSIIIPISRLN